MSKKPCPVCDASGKCPKCGGRGGGLTYVCGLCHGSKKCPRCGGEGVVEK